MSNSSNNLIQIQTVYTCRKCRAKHNVYNPDGNVERLKCERCFIKYFTKDLDNGKIELGITPEEVKKIWLKE
jgi:DNA-directed RNA polymerase subunit RPC12/RpoP